MNIRLTPTTPLSTRAIEPLESRIAPATLTVLDVEALAGPDGFVIHLSEDFLDTSIVSDAGDVNGDGFDDIIVGTQDYASGVPGIINYRPLIGGASYVVFGKSGGFPRDLELATLNGTNGFKITGEASGGFAGTAVSAAGDVNGDGVADLLVGSTRLGADGFADLGAGYVIFGQRGPFAPVLNLATLNGTNGFKIAGGGATGAITALSDAGDVNGDGFDDVILAAERAGANGPFTGSAYVVFGHAGAFTPTLDPTGLTGANGFRIDGGNVFGRSVSGAGDVNGDGLDDVVISDRGNESSATAYVVFGHRGAFTPVLQAASLNGVTGFKINGARESTQLGISVSGAGDFNADGFDDVALGTAQGNKAYVIFGHAGAFSSSLDVSALNGVDGLTIAGELFEDDPLFVVSSAGDVNGDGIADLLLGAPFAEVPGNRDNIGVTYVLYGREGGFGSVLDLKTITDATGVRIATDKRSDAVSGAGDVNRDGFDDVLIGGGLDAYVLIGGSFDGLAPNISVDGKTATFRDVDGDSVTVKTTRGTFDPSNFALYPVPGAVRGGAQLSALDVSAAEFAGANITITARRSALGGDGLVNLGFLNATGRDLGHFAIRGDVGRFVAGDANDDTAALLSLTATSAGLFGTSTQYAIAKSSISEVVGAIPSLKIIRDLRGIELEAGVISLFRVGGSLDGTSIDLNGGIDRLLVGGDMRGSNISAANIGSIEAGQAPGKFVLTGGASVHGSMYFSYFSVGGDVAKITIGGQFVQSFLNALGDFAASDQLTAQTIGEIVINGRVERSYIVVGATENGDVQVGPIRVGGDWISSTLLVGANSGPDSSFGTADDVFIQGGNPDIVSSVASIIIGGQVFGTVVSESAGDHYGFVAERIGFFQTGRIMLPLTSGPDVFELGPTFDITLRDRV